MFDTCRYFKLKINCSVNCTVFIEERVAKLPFFIQREQERTIDHSEENKDRFKKV
jgi:hypothetical protein